MLALAMAPADAGHDAVVCSSPDNGGWARSLGCTFEAMGIPLRDNPALAGWRVRQFNRFIRRQLSLQVRYVPFGIVRGCDVVVASGLVWGVRPVAEQFRIPYRYVGGFTPAGLLGADP